MQLPGRLRATTLGDLLGVLHRGGATGTLELTEDRGRTHRVFLTRGLVVAVELDGASESLAEILRRERAADDELLKRSLLRAMASRRLHGQVLIDEFHLAPSVVGRALRRQVQARLGALDELADARVAFRVAVRPPRSALLGDAGGAGDSWNSPLAGPEFLTGRRRARARVASPTTPAAGDRAWRVLGLAPGASLTDIKRAYRRLARTVHPDLHPEATDAERRSLQARFVEITDAYGSLVA